jgi:quinol monooxygenase YgiN
MTAANKLAVLQKIKQEKGVLFGSLSKDLTKQNKFEKWKDVNELAE